MLILKTMIALLFGIMCTLANPALFLSAQVPKKITEGTACKYKGCLTDFVCHTSSVEDARSIFRDGKLLSAVKARNKPGVELAKEPRNAAKDPSDYFYYIMFAWGNCQAGDRLVMERLLGNMQPSEYDLNTGFKPGIRFYFKYNVITSHKNFMFEGYTPAKIKNEIILLDYMFCCIIPEINRAEFSNIIPPSIADRVFYLKMIVRIYGIGRKRFITLCVGRP